MLLCAYQIVSNKCPRSTAFVQNWRCLAGGQIATYSDLYILLWGQILRELCLYVSGRAFVRDNSVYDFVLSKDIPFVQAIEILLSLQLAFWFKKEGINCMKIICASNFYSRNITITNVLSNLDNWIRCLTLWLCSKSVSVW